MPRRLPSWVDGFFDFTEAHPSPALFRRWAAIACIAGVLERKVWCDIGQGPLFPHMYTILVAAPGVGKSVLTREVWDFWSSLVTGTQDGQYLAQTSVTHASLIDELNDAKRKIIRPQDTPSIIDFNSIKVCSNELGTLLPEYGNEFINRLTDIWDGTPYGERRRGTQANFRIDKPQINLLAATTPSYLMNMIPEGAWDQGFLSRTFLIFSGESHRRELFQATRFNAQMKALLSEDIRSIANLYGQVFFEEDAARALGYWHIQGGPPEPSHPKLHSYNIRRTAHLTKLCIIASVSEGDDLRVSLDHYRTALGWLLEAEFLMPDIFKSVSVGGDSRAIEECWHMCYEHWVRTKTPVPESQVIRFLQDRVPIHNVLRILEMMEKSKILRAEFDNEGRAYRPMMKQSGR